MRRTVVFSRPANSTRSGQALALLAAVLPAILAVVMLAVDAGMTMSRFRDTQHVVDAAATAAARDLALGKSAATARATALDYVRVHNGITDAEVTVNIPPHDGPYRQDPDYVEVIASRPVSTFFAQALGNTGVHSVGTRAVAGLEPATAGAAIVVLDPHPSPITISALSLVTLTVPPVNVGGLEVLGLGSVKVDGAVLVNTEWGGVDEDRRPVGESSPPPYGATCMPLLPLTRLRARDIRVVGGVADPDCYGPYVSGDPHPLQANRLAVPDPLKDLPVPTTATDPINVLATNYGGVSVTGLPLIGPPKHLYPGVYDWIQVVSGIAVFHPGVYIIRGKHPLTQISLSIVAGRVLAEEGVLFYVTNASGYSASSGAPDASDGETEPAAPGVTTLIPSVVINSGLLGSQIRGLDDPGSPFDGMVIYQRRQDRRPILLVGEDLLGSNELSGRIYAKWGQVMFVGNGAYDLSIAAGTVRFVDALNTTLQPKSLLPAAKDVYLVE